MNNELSADLEDEDPLKEIANEYEVKIILTPKGEAKANLELLDSIRNFFVRRRFGTQAINRGLDEFEKCTVSTKNDDANSTKTFDWNNRDEELLPAVFLKDRVPIGDDGTPVFNSLNTFCHNLFNTQILPEIRPDMNVERVDDNA